MQTRKRLPGPFQNEKHRDHRTRTGSRRRAAPEDSGPAPGGGAAPSASAPETGPERIERRSTAVDRRETAVGLREVAVDRREQSLRIQIKTEAVKTRGAAAVAERARVANERLVLATEAAQAQRQILVVIEQDHAPGVDPGGRGLGAGLAGEVHVGTGHQGLQACGQGVERP